MKRAYLTFTGLILTGFILSSCVTQSDAYQPLLTVPEGWSNITEKTLISTDQAPLQGWWKSLNDPALTQLIDIALEESPDRRMAEARVLEARGLRKTTFSSLLPQIGASAQSGQSDRGAGSGNFYDAGFDASYEVDIFGANRNASSAADKNILALEAEYRDTSLTLIAEIARVYIEMRGYQKQSEIAKTNLEIQQETLILVKQLFEAGESPKLDLERAEGLVNTTKASIPEFERLVENAKLSLSVLVGKMPQDLSGFIQGPARIPGGDIQPVLMAPAAVIAQRPDIRAAAYNLEQRTDLSQAALAQIFPTFTLSGFYGVTKTAILSSTSVWDVAIGAAVSLIDFGRIQGQIDAARARETQAFEMYRKALIAGVVDVESALNDYAQLNERDVSLTRAYENAEKAFALSQSLYKEGEISFLDLLIAQRDLNDAEASMVAVQSLRAQALVGLYKSLGVGP